MLKHFLRKSEKLFVVGQKVQTVLHTTLGHLMLYRYTNILLLVLEVRLPRAVFLRTIPTISNQQYFKI